MVSVSSDFTEEPILTIKSGTCPNVIADSTRCLQQCIQDQLTHLDNRARALATSGNFEAAFKDVARIRQLAPSSAVGYLCAGHVYSLQGRQKAAIDIYDQGLATVPSLDPFLQQLVEAQSMAQERDGTRIDFIKEFPIDIIENIAPRILSQEMIAPSEIREYLDVSRVWREKLLMWTRELRILSTSKDDLAEDADLLEQVAPHCTALTLDTNATGFLRQMSETRFLSLQTLIADFPRADDDDEDDYDYYSVDEDDDDDDDDDVSGDDEEEEEEEDEDASGDDNNDKHFYHPEIAALVSLGSTLTHLEIMSSPPGVWLGGILSSCPNLVHLQTENVDPDMANGPESHPNLKRLLFWADEGESVDIHDITKRLPGLEVFATSPFYFYDTKTFKTVQDNCPNLKVNGCSDEDVSFYEPTTTTSTTTRNQNHGDQQDCNGVRAFYVDFTWTHIHHLDLKDIMDFMRRNSHTLQHVYFYMVQGGRDACILNRAIQTADGALFKSLTTFTNCIYDHGDILLTRWIARESPHLRELKLLRDYSNFAGPADTSALFDDLIGCCELESVLFVLHGDPTMDIGGIERFFQHHSTFDSLLHTLILPKDTRLSKDALHALAKLPRLVDLSISWPWLKEEDQEDEKCTHLIGKLNRLQHLEIRCDEVVPENVFLQLSKLNITSLKLHLKPISESSKLMVLLSLLQCPNLQKLFVYTLFRNVGPFVYEIENMLKNKIEEVNFNTYYLWTRAR